MSQRILKIMIIPMLIIALNINAHGEILTLEKCYIDAEKSHPLLKQKDLLKSINNLKLDNLSVNWLPQFDLNLISTYQSDITKIDFDMPAVPGFSFPTMPSPDKDQHKVQIEVNQMIYDGGVTKAVRLLTQNETDIALQKVETGFNNIKQKINLVYFNLLSLNERKKIMLLWRNDLLSRIKVMYSMIKNGILLSSGLNEIEVKILEIEQTLDEISIYYEMNLTVLSELIGYEIPGDVILICPEYDIDSNQDFVNPQVRLFNYQIEKMDVLKSVAFKKKLPKIVGFGRLGYGKPGLNMLSDEFDDYYIAGVSMQWNIFDWKKNKREREQIELNQQLISSQKSSYQKSLNIELENQISKIRTSSQKIEKDHEIIKLRIEILKQITTQFENGVVNTTDYIESGNNVAKAKLSLEIHKIELNLAKVNYSTIKGEL